MKIKNIFKKIKEKIEKNFLTLGLFSLFWFLIRSVKKPSRAVYPCQKVAVFNIWTMLYLIPLVYGCKIKNFFKNHFNWNVVFKKFLLVLLIFLITLFLSFSFDKTKNYAEMKQWEEHIKHPPLYKQSDSLLVKNSFIVSAQSPRVKVISIRDSRAENYIHGTSPGYWWQYVNQSIVSNMVDQGVLTLTGKSTVADAWNDIIPYSPGDQIAIKINQNNDFNCASESEYFNQIPETLNAVISGLKKIGVPEENIWVFDASRVVPNRIINPIRALYPGVRFFSFNSWHTCNEQTTYVSHDSPYATTPSCGNVPSDVRILPPQLLVDAEHLINIPLFRSHGSYPTLALKNHYGTVYFSNSDRSQMHTYFEQGGGGGCNLNTEHLMADINNNPLIRDKTRLIIGDGIFGNQYTNWQSVTTWSIFDNEDPKILFFSKDPVAISSVMLDYIVAERGAQSHAAFHAASLLGLGVHEHWDNFENKQYTAIDYIQINLDTQTCSGLCLENSCSTYNNCSVATGDCSGGYYCCQGNCILPGPICGNNIIELPEICECGPDGICGTLDDNLNEETCQTLGYDSGTLYCSNNCLSYNTFNCTITTPMLNLSEIVTLQDMLGAYQQYKRNEVSLIYFLDKLRRWIVFW